MRWVKSWMLAMVAVLALGAAVLAVDYATRDDAGDTAYQGMGTGGEGAPIQITADAYGRLWVNVGADSTLTAPVAKTPTHLAAVIIGAPGTPGVLASDGTFFTYAVLQAGRAAAANASLITIGGNTAYTSQRATELAPADTWTLTPPAGTKWDLNDFYIDGVDTDDGVRIMYVAP